VVVVMRSDQGRCGCKTGTKALRMLLAALLAVLASVVLATGALAAGKTVKVGEPFESGAPSVAVDSSGTAVIAWANTKDLAGANNFVQYCVLPVGATGCSHSGNLTPADSAAYVDDVQVLVDGSTIVILADVYGAAGENSREYAPEQEWQSTDGGATWTLIDGGQSVADGVINADTAPLNAVIVPGTGVLGYGWNTAGGSPPTFDAFPLSSPPQCSTEKCPSEEAFAELEPNTNPDQISNAGGQFASQAGAHQGILGVFNTDFSNGPLGCSGSGTASFGTAFAYGAGAQSATNDYDISPGKPNSAWLVPVTQADCNVEYPAVGGGPSGFGVLEDELASNHTVYHAFDEATHSFSSSKATVADEFEEQPGLSQDGKGGIYATFLGGGAGGPISLAYSSDGGKTWSGPGVLNADSDNGASELSSAVDATGLGWAVWTDNGSVYAQPFEATDATAAAVSPPVVEGAATSTSTTVTVTVTCKSLPCTITITITVSEASTARKGHGKPKKTTLASGTFTIHKRGADKLRLHLTKAGRKLLARHHGRLSATLIASEKTGGHTAKTTKLIKIKPAKSKSKK
jgi:hypothetical protein